MAGIAGIYNYNNAEGVNEHILQKMISTFKQRGECSDHFYVSDGIGYVTNLNNQESKFARERVIYDNSNDITILCNTSIFNHREIRNELVKKGYHNLKYNSGDALNSPYNSDFIFPLYQEYGIEFLKKLNGQFTIAIYNKKEGTFILARDHFGISPLFYQVNNSSIIFASEIKGILAHPRSKKEINMLGLDQLFTFPGMSNGVTMFKEIDSVKPGHYVKLQNGVVEEVRFWDMNYPNEDYNYSTYNLDDYVEVIQEKLVRSIKLRTEQGENFGFYLSGGLDSSLIGAILKKLYPERIFNSFSLYSEDSVDYKHQNMMTKYLQTNHVSSDMELDWAKFPEMMKRLMRHSECPQKDISGLYRYHLSSISKSTGINSILSGDGADELFGGHVGYIMDSVRTSSNQEYNLDNLFEEQVQMKLWGDKSLFYEKKLHELNEVKKALYSSNQNETFETFNSINNPVLDANRVINRDRFNQRSYLDINLRLCGHLIPNHCGLNYANGIEGRYPFLDVELAETLRFVPPKLKVDKNIDKYFLRKVADQYLPKEIITRQKFEVDKDIDLSNLLKQDWFNDLLSHDTIKRQGYFNPDSVTRLKNHFIQRDSRKATLYQDNYLLLILTFNLFLETFQIDN